MSEWTIVDDWMLADSVEEFYSKYDYIVYIDESGDAAYDKMTDASGRGACDYLILGAALIERKNRKNILDWRNQVFDKISKKNIHHITDISKHYEKVYFYKIFNKLSLDAFGLISYKKTLLEGKYKAYRPETYYKFYHLALKFLLEVINNYLKKLGIPASKVVFIIEENNAFIPASFRKYIKKIQTDGHYLLNIDADNFLALSKKEDKLTILGDAISHALYSMVVGQFVNKTKIVEARYFQEIQDKFCNKEEKKDFNRIKFIHTIEDVHLQQDVKKIFQEV